MDISSTATQSTQPVKTQPKTSVKTKTDVSFEDEIKKSSNMQENEPKETTEEKDEKIKETKTDKKEETKDDKNPQINKTMSSEMAMIQNQENLVAYNNIQALLNANEELTSITEDLNISLKIDYTTLEMGENDAKFFYELTQNTDKTLQNVVDTINMGTDTDIQEVQKNIQISKTLMETISEATKTNQPFRINFDKDISVIIKIDKDGSVSAKFIPGDKAVEEYLKQNISTLRQSFDNQELPYKELSYSKQQEKQQQRKKNNKENSNE